MNDCETGRVAGVTRMSAVTTNDFAEIDLQEFSLSSTAFLIFVIWCDARNSGKSDEGNSPKSVSPRTIFAFWKFSVQRSSR